MKLPILPNPPIIYTPVHSHFVSIILQNIDGYNWLMDHYINIYLRIKEDKNDQFFETQASYTDLSLLDRNYSPFLTYYHIPRNLIKCVDKDLKELLDKNFYIFARLNQRYIQAAEKRFQKMDFYHTALIRGYENGAFIVTDYFKEKMETQNIGEDYFFEAFANVASEYNSPHFHYQKDELAIFSLNQDTRYDFSVDLFRATLKDYLYGNDSTARNYNESPWFNPWKTYKIYHGVNCLGLLPELLFKGRVGVREFYLLFEWAELMEKRMFFLIEKGIITKNAEDLMQHIKEIKKWCKRLELLAIKYCCNNSKESRSKILELVNIVVRDEKEWINVLLESI